MSLVTMQRSQEAELWRRLNQMNTPLCSMECHAMENANAATWDSFLQIAKVFSKNKKDQWDTQKYVLEETSKFLLKKVLDTKGHSRE